MADFLEKLRLATCRATCALFGVVVFICAFSTTNSFADGYVCSSAKQYTSCKSGYYMTYNGSYDGTPKANNACTQCTAGYKCSGGTANRVACSTMNTTQTENITNGTRSRTVTYSSSAGASSCTASYGSWVYSCDAGTYANGSECSACTGATYVNADQSGCIACPDGYTADTSDGKTSITQCKKSCSAGNYYAADGYEILDYIQSSGTQMIDTGVSSIGIGMKTQVKVRLTSSSTSEQAIIGRTAAKGYEIYFTGGNTIGSYHDSNGTQKAMQTISYNTSTDYIITSEMTSNKITQNVNGTISTYSGTLTTTPATGNLTLFKHTNNYAISARLYYATFWQNGTLVRNFVPVKRKSDSAVGLYDTVNGVFYANTGTGSFTAGTKTGDFAASCSSCPAGKYCSGTTVAFGASAAGITGNCNAGTYSTGGASAATCTACTTTSGWTTTSPAGSGAYTACYQTQTPSNCASGTIKRTASSISGTTITYGSASVTAALSSNSGYYVNGTACSQCAAGTYYGGGTATSCTACTTTSGWTTTSPAGSGAYTACYQTQTPSNCASGTIKRTASSISGTTITYGSASVTAALSSNSGYYVNGTSCSQCSAGTYYGGGTATSCTACTTTSGWTTTSPAGSGAYTACYQTQTPSNCASGTIKRTASSISGTTITYGSASVTSALSSNSGYYVNGTSCSQCSAGTYYGGGTATSCTACTTTSGWTTTSPAGSGAYTACYQTRRPGNCSNGNTKRSASSISGTTITYGTEAVDVALGANAGYYVNGLVCSACGGNNYYCAGGTATRKTVDSGYYSTGGDANTRTGQSACEAGYYCSSGVRNECGGATYSTGSATSCSSIDAGYFSSGGGKSKTPSSSDCLSGKSCGQCPSGYRNIAASSQNGCVGTFSKSGSQTNPTQPSSWYSRSLTDCTPGSCNYTKNYGGSVVSDCTPTNCERTQTATACNSGYYLSSGSCPACSGLASGFYPNSANGNSSGSGACYTNSISGQYVAKNASSATNCGSADKYKGSHTVNYGSSSSCSTVTAGYYTTGGTTATRTGQSQCGGNAYYCSGGVRNDVSSGYYSTGGDANTRTGQAQCTGSTYCASGVQNNCPSADSGWTQGTGTGWTARTQCYEYKTPDNCSSGSVKRNGDSSSNAYASAITLNSTLKANANSWTTTTATSCSTCPSAYPTSAANTNSGQGACYKSCSAGYYWKGSSEACTACTAGNWCAGTTANYTTTSDKGLSSCSSNLGTGYTSAGGTGDTANTKCYLTLSGKVRSGTSGTTTTDCNSGSYKGSHNEYYGTSYSCDTCSAGTYSGTSGAITSCSNCEGRTKYSGSGASSCSTVTSGYYTTGCNSSGNLCTGQSQCTGRTKYCSSGVENTVSSGYYTTGCTSNNGCTGQTQCSGSTYCASGVQNNCPTADSGWTAGTGTGWTARTSCYEYQTPTNCASGSVKRNGDSSSNVYASTITLNSTLKAKANYYTTTSATSCTGCPSAYPTSAANTNSGQSACYKSCSAGYYWKGSSEACTACTAGNWCSATTNYYTTTTNQGLNACSSLGTGYTSAGGTGDTANTKCYLPVAAGKVRSGTSGTTLTTCSAGTYKAGHNAYYGTSYSCSNCEGRTKYSAAGAGSCSTVSSGYYTTGCTSNNNCTGESQCTGSTYCSGGVQNNCPTADSGWTAGTGTGWTARTSCYEYQTPTNCASGSVKRNGDSSSNVYAGTITLNSTLKAKANYYTTTSATSCTACPTAYPTSAANTNSGQDACYKSCSAGYYWNGTNQACTACTAGNWCSATTNYYTTTSNQGLNACSTLGTGYTSDGGTGDTANTSCYLSLEGKVRSGTSGTTTSNCNSGKYKGSHKEYYGTSYSCDTCSAGTYSGTSGAITACTACSGTTQYQNETGKTSCKNVDVGYYKSSNSAQAQCPANYQSGAGAATQAGCTASCSAGYAVQSTNGACTVVTTDNKYTANHTVTYGNTSTLSTCNTTNGYTNSGTTYDKHANKSSCKTTCAAGKQVASANAACSTPSGSWYTSSHTVSEGSTSGSNVQSCLTNYATPNTTTQGNHDASTDCTITCSAGSRITTANNTSCTAITSGNVYMLEHTVAQGSASAAATDCPTSYTISGSTQADHNEKSDCKITCNAGNAVLTADATCSSIQNSTYKGKYIGQNTVSAGSTSSISDCPTNYKAANGTTAQSNCETACSAGTQVASTNAACSTPTGNNWYTAAHNVKYGNTSGSTNVKSCKTGYTTANTGTATDHDAQGDCKISCGAGYYIPTAGGGCVACTGGKYCSGASNIAETATSAVTGSITAGYFCAGGAKTATPTSSSDSVTSASCGKCTGTGTNGRQVYSNAGANACSECPAVTGTLASRVTSYSGYWGGSDSAHDSITGCYVNFSDSDDDATYNTFCYYNTTDSNYGTTNSRCYTKQPTACAAGKYNTITSTSEWVGASTEAATCYGADCMKGKVCTDTDAGKYSAEGSTTQANVTAGYYCSGGCKTATPTSSSDCLSGNTCGKCTTDSTTGRPAYSNAGASSCTACPAVSSSSLSGRVTGYSGWWNSDNIRNSITGCSATFTDSDSDATFKITCWYNTTDADYGGAHSYCQVYPANVTACAAGKHKTLESSSIWNGSSYGTCSTGADCANGKVCTNTTAGYYSPADALTQTACATGSYSSAGSSTCTACPAGKTTSGTGTAFSTSADNTCSTACSAIANRSTWGSQTWSASNNSVTGLCSVGTCVAGAYKSGNTCPVCGDDTWSNAGASSCSSCATDKSYGNSGTAASAHAGSTSCTVTCSAGNYVAETNGACVGVGDGYYRAGNETVAYGSTGSRNACSSISGVSVSGGSYGSTGSRNASSTCTYTAPTPTKPANCATKTSNTVTYSGTAWPTSTYAVTANAGSIIVDNNTADATCEQCSGANYSAGGSAASCTNCPTQTSGWTRGTGTGWSSYSSCYETQKPAHCESGSVKHTAKNASEWNTAVSLVSTLTASNGYYASSSATSCSACPSVTSGYSYVSGTGWTAITQCKETKPYSSVSTNCYSGALTKTANSGGTWDAATSTLTAKAGYKTSGSGDSATCSACGDGYYSANSNDGTCDACTTTSGWATHTTSNTAGTYEACYQTRTPANCASGNTKRTASSISSGTITYGSESVENTLSSSANYYVNGTTCTGCPSGYPNSAGGTGGVTQCYSNDKSRAWTGSQVNGATPTGCTVTAWNACSNSACDYVAYANAAGTGDGTIKSGCSTNNASCTKTVKTVSANNGYYAASTATSCTACPALTDGYSFISGTGWNTYSDCVSTKSVSACASGALTRTADSASTWAAPVSTLSAGSNKYVTGSGDATTCTGCPSGYPNSAGGTGGVTQCYSNDKSRAWTGSQTECTNPDTTGCSGFTCGTCSNPACDYVAYANAAGTGDGTIKSGCSTNNSACQKPVASLTAKANYYVNGTTSCPTCTSKNSSYPKSDGGDIGYGKCYVEVVRGCTKNNGSTPSNCSVTAYNDCSCTGDTYKSYADSTTSGTTTNETCIKTVKTVSANAGYYVDGLTCPICTGVGGGLYPNSNAGNTGGASACYTDEISGKYVAANATVATNCAAGSFKGAHQVNYGSSSSCSVCDSNKYSDAGSSSCTACATANGYGNSGSTANDHAGVTSCTVSCPGGSYVATSGGACVDVTAGYYKAAHTVAQTQTSTRGQCATGLTTIGYGAGADEAGDCGRVLHTGTGELYLRSDKKTEPSLNVKIGNTTYYGNMSTSDKVMSDGQTEKLKVKDNGTTYSVHDDSVN